MSQYPQYRSTIPYAAGEARTGVVATFMNGVYAWMCVGLLLTAVVAWVTAHSEASMQFVRSWFILLILAELGLVVVLSAAINRLSAPVATGFFATYAALNGLTLSGIFIVYQLGTIGAAFAVTGGMFAAMSAIGYITKKDLSGIGGICLMALIGLIIASIVNMFMRSEPLYWLITYALVLVFAGLTAYDTQKLKEIAYATADDEAAAKRLTILGSLTLYLDFINLLLLILRVVGGKRR